MAAKKGISKAMRFLLILISTIMIAVTFLSAYICVEDSTMLVDYGDD